MASACKASTLDILVGPSGASVFDVLLRRPKHSYGAAIGAQATADLYLSLNYKFTGKRVDKDFSTYPAVNRTLNSINY
ncbi:MAG: hypothetical protein EOO43_04820 [Flavobacterium sp.]|nr:MAG: hypothetical protein EOO43_04820 [Flavobacterium sp.]